MALTETRVYKLECGHVIKVERVLKHLLNPITVPCGDCVQQADDGLRWMNRSIISCRREPDPHVIKGL